MRTPHSLCWALDVQTFWPVTTHSSPSSTARVRSEARSEPASGSLKSWHHSSSPRSIGPSHRCCWSVVPCCMSVGATMPWATAKIPVDTPHFACSSAKIASWIGLPPRPPNAFGHAMPAQPASWS